MRERHGTGRKRDCPLAESRCVRLNSVESYAYSKDTGDNEVMDWVVPYGQGRVYTTMLGHLWKDGPDTALRCVGFRTLLIRGCQWAATGAVTYPVPADFPTDSEFKLAN